MDNFTFVDHLVHMIICITSPIHYHIYWRVHSTSCHSGIH